VDIRLASGTLVSRRLASGSFVSLSLVSLSLYQGTPSHAAEKRS
jgi:hypothetical protein